MSICAAQGWTLDEWRALPDDEKDLWFRFYTLQQRRKAHMRERLNEKKMLTPETAVALLDEGW